MNDLEITSGTNAEYFTAFITFWVVLVVWFLLITYIWQRYTYSDRFDISRWFHQKMRDYCARDGYDGYWMYRNRITDKKEHTS